MRIHENLKTRRGFAGGYHAVPRFVRRLLPREDVLPLRRMECAPEKELQVNFGQGVRIEAEIQRRDRFRRLWSYKKGKGVDG